MPYLDKADIEVVVSDNSYTTTHTHSFLEIAYVAKGSANHIIGNLETIITQGNYFIVDYNTEHSYKSIENAPLIIVNILFNPRLIDRSLENCRSFNTMLEHYLIKFGSAKLMVNPSHELFFDNDGSIRELITKLTDEHEKQEAGYVEVMRSYLIALIVMTMRKIAASGNKDDLLSRVYERVSLSQKVPPTLRELAEELRYSQSYLSARFKELSGMGYREYLLNIRMKEAMRLLANTEKKVSEIAEEIGYFDVNSFYIAFKKVVGTTPLIYRKSLAKNHKL